MKKAIIVTILVALVLVGGFWLYIAKTHPQQPLTAANSHSQTATDQSQPPSITILGVDTDDHLDPAIQDLQTVEFTK